MKIRVNRKTKIISEGVDKGYLNSIGIAVGKRLGSGMFGKVYEIAADLGDGTKSYALKYVDSALPSREYTRERSQYQSIKKFVDSAKEREDKQAIKLSAFLPIIYSVSEHERNLYIVMEKLIPLSDEENKLFMSELSGLAYHYSKKGHKSRGDQLIDYIEDRDGDVGVEFGRGMAVAIINYVSGGPEYKHLKANKTRFSNMILSGGSDSNAKIVMDAWIDSDMADHIRHAAIETLYRLNPKFKRFFNGVCNLLVGQHVNPRKPDSKFTDDSWFVGLVMSQVFDFVFSQKYPMKYVGDKDRGGAWDKGHGESSEVWDSNVDSNTKLEEKTYDISGVAPNPAKKSSQRSTPQKYPFDRFISAIRRLGRDWGVEAKDMHNANVMKRTNGQYVVADIGLFDVKQIQGSSKGIAESKIKIKIT